MEGLSNIGVKGTYTLLELCVRFIQLYNTFYDLNDAA